MSSATATSAAKFLAAIVKDLKGAGAEALVVAGPRQPASVHAIAALINQSLGSDGGELHQDRCGEFGSRRVEEPGGRDFVGPGFDAVDSWRESGVLGAGGFAVRDGTREGCRIRFILVSKKTRPRPPRSGTFRRRTSLRRWSDARSSDGTVAIQQPMIGSMYGGKTPAEMIAMITGGKDQESLRHRQELLAAAAGREDR